MQRLTVRRRPAYGLAVLAESYKPSVATRPITVALRPTIVGINATPSPIYTNTPFRVTGGLWEYTSPFPIPPWPPIPNATIKVYYGPSSNPKQNYVGSCVTDSNGAWKIDVTIPMTGTYRVQANFEGDAVYAPSYHISVEFTVIEAAIDTALTILAPDTALINTPFSVTGKLTRIDTGAGIPSMTITLSCDTIGGGTTITDSAGNYAFDMSISATGAFTLKAEFAGIGTFAEAFAIRSIGVTGAVVEPWWILGLIAAGVVLVVVSGKGR